MKFNKSTNREDRDIILKIHLYKFGYIGDYTNWDKPCVEVFITSHDVEMREDTNPFVDIVM